VADAIAAIAESRDFFLSFAALDALAAISDDELRRRFAPDAMMRAEIYPEIWDRDPEEDDTLGYLMEYVAVLREMLGSVTSRGHGLMVVLS